MAGEWQEALGAVEDPRSARGVRHRLDEMLLITVFAVTCGVEDAENIAQYARSKEEWLRTFLELPHGIPCGETFRRLLAAIRPEQLDGCLNTWLQGWKGRRRNEVVAVDGKTLRRSFDRASGKAAVHMISAWATDAGISLGQLAVGSKQNELSRMPELLDMLDLRGATVTIDAIGCQRNIAEHLIRKQADYVLALKLNQPTLYEEAKTFLDAGIAQGFEGAHDICEHIDKGHGRIEIRRTWASQDIDWFEDKAAWPGMRTWVAVESERHIGDKVSVERRYFITSLSADATRIAHAVRSHWGIENSLHWVLDMAFGEDQARLRTGYAAENFSRIRRFVLALLKKDKTTKVGMKGRRMKAGWNDDYLLRVLTP